MKEGRTSFLKKRRPARGSKKLFIPFGRGGAVYVPPRPKGRKSFLVLFFKKEHSCFLRLGFEKMDCFASLAMTWEERGRSWLVLDLEGL